MSAGIKVYDPAAVKMSQVWLSQVFNDDSFLPEGFL